MHILKTRFREISEEEIQWYDNLVEYGWKILEFRTVKEHAQGSIRYPLEVLAVKDGITKYMEFKNA